MVISASNGLVDISNLSQNEKVEVAYKSAIDFLSDSIPQKAKDVIINSKSAKSIVDYITKQSLR